MEPKPKRIKDPKLIKELGKKPCTACGAFGATQVHHVKTVGAGGHDTRQNCIPLCMKHHAAWHNHGAGWMVRHFPKVLEWLMTHQREDVLDRILK